MLALVRPSLVQRLRSGPELRLGHPKLVGRQAIVTEDVTSHSPGRVKLAGEIWTAQPYDESLTIKAGETVDVLAMKGATVYVHPAHTAIEP
jgi:membrane protein implicated in regulation of membrane protease activity